MLCLKRRRGLICLKGASQKENKRGGSFLTVIREIHTTVSHFVSAEEQRERFKVQKQNENEFLEKEEDEIEEVLEGASEE